MKAEVDYSTWLKREMMLMENNFSVLLSKKDEKNLLQLICFLSHQSTQISLFV